MACLSYLFPRCNVDCGPRNVWTPDSIIVVTGIFGLWVGGNIISYLHFGESWQTASIFICSSIVLCVCSCGCMGEGGCRSMFVLSQDEEKQYREDQYKADQYRALSAA